MTPEQEKLLKWVNSLPDEYWDLHFKKHDTSKEQLRELTALWIIMKQTKQPTLKG